MKPGLLIVAFSVVLLVVGFYRQERVMVVGDTLRVETSHMWGRKPVAVETMKRSLICSVGIDSDMQFFRGRTRTKYFVRVKGAGKEIRLSAFSAFTRSRVETMRDGIERGLQEGAYRKTRYVDIVLAYAFLPIFLFGIGVASGLVGTRKRKKGETIARI